MTVLNGKVNGKNGIKNGVKNGHSSHHTKTDTTILSPTVLSGTSNKNICAILVLLLLALMSIYYSTTVITTRTLIHTPPPKTYENTGSHGGYVVFTPGCKIPDMDPRDPSIKSFVSKPKEIICNKTVKKVFDTKGNKLLLNKTALHRYYNVEEGHYNCCYQIITRDTPKSNLRKKTADNKFSYSKRCHFINHTETEIYDEFIRVICKRNKTGKTEEFHKDFLAFVPRKLSIAHRLRAAQHTNSKEKISVAIYGIDAVSRLNMVRQFPQTRSYIFNNLSAIEMLGYNKVGDNTFPNLIPVLTGFSEEELKSVCWPNQDDYFDECPLIWKKFSSLGYRTSFGEDAAWMGLFSYQKSGFLNPPVDYYLRPIAIKIASEIGHNKDFNSKLCYGHRLAAEFMANYFIKFCTTFKHDLFFQFLWTVSLSHDYLNYPNLEDGIVENMFKKLHEDEALNNTVVILMSDHGIRWGDIRKTYQGKVEERLPFLIFIFPPWFRDKYNNAVSNLIRNQRRLTTPFDLHETLNDLTDLALLEKDTLKIRTQELYLKDTIPRAVSLFLPVPETRTCNLSGITEHWCTCHQSKAIPSNSSIVLKSTEFLMSYLNNLLKPYKQCSKLTLKSIRDSQEHNPENDHLKEDNTRFRDYTVIVEVEPSNAVFEGTIRYNPDKDKMQLTGSISRINVYGNQSLCVDNYDMKKYCYCL